MNIAPRLPAKAFALCSLVALLSACNTAPTATPRETGRTPPSAPLASAEPSRKETPFAPGSLDKVPTPIQWAQPHYPLAARKAGISGTVIVEFIINTKGDVANAKAVKSPNEMLSQAAVAAVMRSKFTPGEKAGRVVNCRMQVPIAFHVD